MLGISLLKIFSKYPEKLKLLNTNEDMNNPMFKFLLLGFYGMTYRGEHGELRYGLFAYCRRQNPRENETFNRDILQGIYIYTFSYL